MLKVSNLIKIYTDKKQVETVALDGMTIDFGDSGLTFILGKSGSGKSTLLNLLGGLDAPTSGEIIFDGRSSRNFTQADYDGWRNESVGFVFQDYSLISDLTVGQNVGLALELQGKAADKEAVNEVLRKVELVDARGDTLYRRQINALSGGQRQRVAVARAIIKNPKLILADEPTGALDSKTGKQLYELLKELSKDRLVIVVTHDEECALNYGDRILTIEDGKIVSDSNESVLSENKEPAAHRSQGKLPAKSVFSLGFMGLKHNKGRLIVTMLLSVVFFTVFGFSVTFFTVNHNRVMLNTMKKHDLSLIEISTGYEKKENDGWTSHTSTDFCVDQRKKIEQYGGYLNLADIELKYNDSENADISYGDLESYFGEKKRWGINPDEIPWTAYEEMLYREIDTAVIVNETVDLGEFGYAPDKRFKDPLLCHMPNNENEIALTDYHFLAFKEFGYLIKEMVLVEDTIGEEAVAHYIYNERKKEIETPDDLIGLRLGKYTICGVYSTEVDIDYMEKHRSEYNSAKNGSYLYYLGKGIMSNSVSRYGIVYESPSNVAEARKNNGIMVRFDGKVGEAEKFFKSLRVKTFIEEENEEKTLTIFTINPVDGFAPDGVVLEIVSEVALYLSPVIGVICILLFMVFLSVNIERRKRELGIMRAVGASKRDVVLVCLAESFFIAMIDFVVSAIAVVVICAVINTSIFTVMFVPGILPMFSLFGLVFLTSGLGTIIPVLRLVKKKPVDILKKAS